MEDIKLCPFRKTIETTNYHWEGDTPLPCTYEEDFLPCMKEKCMAYHVTNYIGWPGTLQERAICQLLTGK